MKFRSGTFALLLLLAVLAAFVWQTSKELPAVVASHFAANGVANGFMPRTAYAVLITVLVVGVPLLLALLPAAAISGAGKKLNIPHREYWLAPERREDTIAFLRAHGRWFAVVVALFLSDVHWLVVEANGLQPPVLFYRSIVTALVVFALALLVWLWALVARFRNAA